MRNYDDRDRRNRYGGGGRRSRSRSPVRGGGRDGRRNNGPSDNRQGNRGYANKRGRDSSPPRERAPHEIYIGNYPVRFREADVRKLFEEHDVKVNTIRLKHDGLKCFAFAETVSQEEVQKAVKSMESVEISRRRLRVRSAADKDKKTSSAGGASQPKKVRRELNVDDVTRHLAYAFVGFLQRQKEAGDGPVDVNLMETVDEVKEEDEEVAEEDAETEEAVEESEEAAPEEEEAPEEPKPVAKTPSRGRGRGRGGRGRK